MTNTIDSIERSIRERVVERLMNKHSFDNTGANILYECARADGLLEKLVHKELYGQLSTEHNFIAGAEIISDKIMKTYE